MMIEVSPEDINTFIPSTRQIQSRKRWMSREEQCNELKWFECDHSIGLA
jgi:hypothetical protein